MKVGIITINSQNMGNRLQNYAVQHVIKSMGYDVLTLNNDYCGREVTTFKHTLKICVTGKAFPNLFRRRREAFIQFNNKYIAMHHSVWKPGIAPEGVENEFDFFVCGSDQIWNPFFDFITDNEYLKFAKPEQRIAYAASIGVDQIPESMKELFLSRIKDFKAISVREKAGASIIYKLLGKEVPVLIDPTLMLRREDWLKIAEKPKEVPNKKYLLTYFLGEKDANTKKFINTLAKEKCLEIVNLWDVKYKKYFLTSPSEFLYYIANCELMCTDSFHGSIFSVIMGVPFSVHKRVDNVKSMNSRLDTLLETLELESHLWSKESSIEDFMNHDYTIAYKKIKTEKMRVNEFLNNAFERI